MRLTVAIALMWMVSSSLCAQAAPVTPSTPIDTVAVARRGAEQGDALSQFALGMLLEAGRGVAKDFAEAARWYRAAADQGNALAQHNLGTLYEFGRGVPKSDSAAVAWYLKAATQGHPWSQHNLGNAYARGVVVPKDAAEAVRWYTKAAEQGLPNAQWALAEAYAGGRGVVKDRVQAHMWASLAAPGFAKVGRVSRQIERLRKSLERKMSDAELADAKAMAADWRPAKSFLAKP